MELVTRSCGKDTLKWLFGCAEEGAISGLVGNTVFLLVSSFFAPADNTDQLILSQLQTIQSELDTLEGQMNDMKIDLDSARWDDVLSAFKDFQGDIENIDTQAGYLKVDSSAYAGFADKYASDEKRALDILKSDNNNALLDSFGIYFKDVRAWDKDCLSDVPTSFSHKLMSVTDAGVYVQLKRDYELLDKRIDDLAGSNASKTTELLKKLYDIRNHSYAAFAVALGMIDRLNKMNMLMGNPMSSVQGNTEDEMDAIYKNNLDKYYDQYQTDVDKNLSGDKGHLGFIYVRYCSKLTHSIEVKLDSDNTHVFEVWSTLAPGKCLDSYPQVLSGDNAVHLQTTAYGQAEDHEGGRVPSTTERALNVDDKNRELTNVDGASYHPSKTNERDVVMTIASCESQIDNKQLHWWNTTRYTIWKCKGDAIVTSYNIDDPKTPPTCPAPSNLIAKKDGSNVDVTWIKQDNIKTYKIFDSTMKEMGAPIDGSSTQFTDKNVGPSSNYRYFVQSTCSDGTQSTLSEADTNLWHPRPPEGSGFLQLVGWY